MAECARYTTYEPNVVHSLHIVSFHISGPFESPSASDRFFTYYNLSAGPSNVYDGHHRYTYFVDENAINASGTRQIHRLEMALSKTVGGTVLSFEGSVKNLESHSFNGFVLLFIVENGLVDPSYPTITWNSVFRDYGLNKTLSLAGSSTDTFQGAWNIPSSVNTNNLQVVAVAYDADERDTVRGWPYAVQSVCDVCGHILVVLEEEHDIAVTGVESYRRVVAINSSTNVTVTVANQGNFMETFNVTVYANSTLIGTQTLTLDSGQCTNLTFVLNTTKVPISTLPVNCTLQATASLVQNETYTENNSAACCIQISIKGDINADGKVDIKDIAAAAKAFGTGPGDIKWQANADVNEDNQIDIRDIAAIAKEFGKTT